MQPKPIWLAELFTLHRRSIGCGGFFVPFRALWSVHLDVAIRTVCACDVYRLQVTICIVRTCDVYRSQARYVQTSFTGMYTSLPLICIDRTCNLYTSHAAVSHNSIKKRGETSVSPRFLYASQRDYLE